VHARVAADPDLLPEVIAEVLRYDPPVQNTRRFLAQDLSLAGQTMPAGDAILVVLAAAGRDPSANPNPAHFDIFRKYRPAWTFGAGPHACPGAALAVTIAAAGITQLLTSGADPEQLTTPAMYRPSQNLRIALAASAES
jgi:cytochrome P450